MRKYFIILFFLSSVNSYSQVYFGGIDVGGSYNKFNDSDSLSFNPAFSPTFGFTINKNLKPKLYGTVSVNFTQRNGTVISPNQKYKSFFVDWRLSLKYKPTTKFYLEAGAVAEQFLGGKIIRSQSKSTLDGILNNQVNPFFGASFDVNSYMINAKFYVPRVLVNAGSFNPVNQFKYADLTVTIPIKSKKDKEQKEKDDKSEIQAQENIKELKSGILLIALPESKAVKDKELGSLLASAFEKNYNFSRYFIIDESSIDSLVKTGKIDVYEAYPFLAKQTIDLTNITWYYATVGKTSVADGDTSESYNINGIFMYNKNKRQLKAPFPFYMAISGNNVDASVKSLNADLERYYYQTVFGTK
ncbi:MAG: hypothetical protein ACLGGV_06265 [Bacteroidia bacterium]